MKTRLADPADPNRPARLAWVAETIARPLVRLAALLGGAR